MTRDDLLVGFLRETAAQPFAWGVRDCALWCCDWIRLARGVDPAAALRRTYASAADCAALLDREGGLAALAGRLFAAAGLAPVAASAAGDVAVVETPVGPALMIACADAWAWKAAGGVLIGPVPAARVLAVWGV